MARERFVLLGVARARSLWFRAVAQWSTSAALPAEFVKCVSAEELRAHLASGRTFSAALVDGGLPTVDRDLIAAAREAGCPVLVVDDGRGQRNWRTLGAAAVLPPGFDREQLLEVLAANARMVGGVDTFAAAGEPAVEDVRFARVVAVCGPGGTGASTAAIALAQHFAVDPRGDDPVLLADLALRAEQAMLHDARDIVPGIQELVEMHRGRRPTPEEVRSLTFNVDVRGYRLLLGLRRARYWSTVRPRSFESAFQSLRTAFGTVVCDVSADFEGEDEGGSVDVEERNVMARTAVQAADAVVVVGVPGVKGLHGLVRVIGDLLEVGVAPDRIVPVINQAPRNPKVRAELAGGLTQLLALPRAAAIALPSPVFLPRRRIEGALRDGALVPGPLGPLLAGAVRGTWERVPRRGGVAVAEPQPVAPGSLGAWTAEDGAQ